MFKRAFMIAGALAVAAVPAFAQTKIAIGTPPIAEVEAAFVARMKVSSRRTAFKSSSCRRDQTRRSSLHS